MDKTPQASEFGRVCAVVVTYNIGDSFRDCFFSLMGQVDHAVIIDNGSSDDTPRLLEELKAQHPHFFDIMTNQSNGLAKAQNMGIRHAREQGFDWIMLLDHDSRLAEGMIDAMKKAYTTVKEPGKIGILAPFIYDENAKTAPSYVTPFLGVFFRRTQFGNRELLDNVINAIASGSLIPTRVFDEVGFMDEQFFIDYIDTDFCLRIIGHGYHIIAVRDAVLYHKLGERKAHRFLCFRIITTNHSPLRRYYIYRNKIKTLRRHIFSVPAYVTYDLSAVVYDVLRILLYEQEKATKMRHILAGIRDAMKGIGGPRPA